jgi:hypothetical protein
MVGGGLAAAMFEAGHRRILKTPDLSSIASVPLLSQCRVTYYMVSWWVISCGGGVAGTFCNFLQQELP